jgi:hypothetical protein
MQRSHIDFAKNELIGVSYHTQVNPLMDAVLQHRGQALLRLLAIEDTSLTNDAANAVETALANFEKSLQAGDPYKLLPILN